MSRMSRRSGSVTCTRCFGAVTICPRIIIICCWFWSTPWPSVNPLDSITSEGIFRSSSALTARRRLSLYFTTASAANSASPLTTAFISTTVGRALASPAPVTVMTLPLPPSAPAASAGRVPGARTKQQAAKTTAASGRAIAIWPTPYARDRKT